MIDFISKHFWPLFYAACVLIVAAVTISVVLFRDLEANPEGTAKAMRKFIGFIRGLRGAVKGEAPPAVDPLAQTVSQPMPAVPPPDKPV